MPVSKLKLVSHLSFIAILMAACAPKDSGTSSIKKEIKKPLTLNEGLLSRPECKVTLSTEQLEHVQMPDKTQIKDSSNLKFELTPDLNVKLDQDFATCFAPFLAFSCRLTHGDSVSTTYTETQSGFMIKTQVGAAWAFISPAADGKSAELTALDDSLTQMYGKTKFTLTVERCH